MRRVYRWLMLLPRELESCVTLLVVGGVIVWLLVVLIRRRALSSCLRPTSLSRLRSALSAIACHAGHPDNAAAVLTAYMHINIAYLGVTQLLSRLELPRRPISLKWTRLRTPLSVYTITFPRE